MNTDLDVTYYLNAKPCTIQEGTINCGSLRSPQSVQRLISISSFPIPYARTMPHALCSMPLLQRTIWQNSLAWSLILTVTLRFKHSATHPTNNPMIASVCKCPHLTGRSASWSMPVRLPWETSPWLLWQPDYKNTGGATMIWPSGCAVSSRLRDQAGV